MTSEASQGCNRWLFNSLQSLRHRAHQGLSEDRLMDEPRDSNSGQGAFSSDVTGNASRSSALSSATIIPTLEQLENDWLSGRISYTDTIYGLWLAKRRLDRIEGSAPQLTSARSAWGNALLAAAPNSQHIFGLSIVTEGFAGAGWNTTTLTDGDPGRLIQVAEAVPADVIGISVGHDEGLVGLAEIIALLRRKSRSSDVKIIVGGNVFAAPTRQYDWLRADFVALSIEDALGYCSRQVQLNVPRH